MNSSGANPRELLDRYIRLEKEIQKLIYPLSQLYCSKCRGECCSEQICKESTESAFLSMLVERQRIAYDKRNGWKGTRGCRLDYGRPLVCYEFFCDNILKSSLFITSNVQTIINDFGSIGKNAHSNIHLICLDNVNILSTRKTEKITAKVNLMIHMIANARCRPHVVRNHQD